MVEVGEMSGQLGEIYKRMARHYDRMAAAKREFWSRLTWPLTQLGIALALIGLLIYIMGMLPARQSSDGMQTDLLGWGLAGTSGLVVYVIVLVILGLALWVFYEAARRRVAWTRRFEKWALAIPVLGNPLKTLALARFTWALQLVFDTPMDLRKALPLALGATGNDYYIQFSPEVAQRIEEGQSITQALAATGVFPADFLDSLAVGEESGSLVETMQRQAAEYEERSASALSLLAQLAGYIVWLIIASFMVFMIFKLFFTYLNTINSLL